MWVLALPMSTWRAKTTSRLNPAEVRGEGQGSERRGLSAGDAPGLHKCKKSPFSLAAWAEFHKGPLCGAYTPPNKHTLSLTHTHTHTHTPPPSAMPTQDTDNGGVSGHHVNLKYFPSLEQKCHPDLPLQTHFCFQFTQEWTTNSSFFLSSYNLTFIHRVLFKCDMVLHSDEG